MSWLGGFGAGLGKAAGDVAHNMLEIQMSRYKGLADVYKTIANNPDIVDPNIKQEAIRRMTLLTNVNPMDRQSMQAVKGMENTKDLWDAHQNSQTQSLGGSVGAPSGGPASQPSLGFKATSGAPATPAQGGGQAGGILTPPSVGSAPQQAPTQPQAPSQSGQSLMTAPNPPTVGMPAQPAQQPQTGGGLAYGNTHPSIDAQVRQLIGQEPQTGGWATPQWKQWHQLYEETARSISSFAVMRQQLTGDGSSTSGGLTSMFGDTGAPPGTPLDNLVKTAWARDAMMKRPPTRPTAGPVIDGHPTTFFNGGNFIDGHPVKQGSSVVTRGASLTFVQDKNTGETYWDYLTPGDPRLGPNGNLTKPLVQSSTTENIDLQGNKNSNTRRGFGKGAGKGGAALPLPPGGGGNPAPTASLSSPADDITRVRDNPMTDDERIISQVMKNPGRFADMNGQEAIRYNMALQKYGLTLPSKEGFVGPQITKEQSGYAGLQALHDIKAGLKGFDYAGPVFGRLATYINEHFASTKAVSALNTVLGRGDKGPSADDVNDYVTQVANDPNQISKMATETGIPISEAARTARQIAYLLTRTRALNAAETAGIAGGGGRGITRLFMMMSPYMMNITQGSNFIEGHGKGIADLLGDEVGNVHLTRWGQGAKAAMATIPASRLALMKEFGQDQKLTGEAQSSNSPATSSEDTTTTYRDSTGTRIRRDGKGGWIDVKTNQPYRATK